MLNNFGVWRESIEINFKIIMLDTYRLNYSVSLQINGHVKYLHRFVLNITITQ